MTTIGDEGQAPSARLPRRRASFELKVIVLCVVATITALAFAFIAFQWQDWRGDRADLAAEQIGLGQMIASEAATSEQAGAGANLAIAGAMARSNDHTESADWFPASGGRIRLIDPKQGEREPPPGAGPRPTAEFTAGGLVVQVPYFVGGHRVGELVLRADDQDITDGLIRNSLIALMLALVATLISALVAKSLAGGSLRPLYALDRGIESVRRSRDFNVRADVTSDDEFGRLSENFNALLADLAAYEKQQRSVQELTAARDAAEEANILKSQFLANMSHEIRTPLNGVLGMAHMMRTGHLAPIQRERLEVIETSGALLLSILDDILDLSKIESGRVELEEAPFDIAEVAGGACAPFAAGAKANGVAFVLEISEAAKGQWRGDGVRVSQLICNLVSNALKFTESGEVRVEIHAAIRETGKALAISVADTGIGIAPEVLPKLFDKFVQADNTMTRRFGGAGLGLAICRHIVDLMGGVIEVRSDVGSGTTFHTVLPLAWLGERMAACEPAEPEASVDLSTLRVLAAEDNETNRLVLRAVLDALGVVPTIVDNGRLAVDAWEAGAFDLVLMDIQMPVLDGVAATREIRRIESQKGLPRTPIIAVTANAMKHQVDEYHAAGLDAHLAKPIVIQHLYAALAGVAASIPAARTIAA